jgi:hypothetical protein
MSRANEHDIVLQSARLKGNDMATGLVFITDEVVVEPSEVCSIQEEKVTRYSSPSPSDSSVYTEFEGSVMTLKNGRKIYVRGMTPKQIYAVLTKSNGSG